MTKQEREALRSLLAKRTEGRWVIHHDPKRWVLFADAEDESWKENRDNDAALVVAAVNALPALLDQVDELERKYRNGYPAGVVANAEDALAERDALKAALVRETEWCGEWATNAAMWAAERDHARAECERWRHDYNELSANHSQARARVEELEGNLASVLAHPPRKRADALEAERDELRFRLTKQQEAREAVEAERDALRQEVERLRQTCDIRGANWERDAAELDQARARVAELERLLIIADAASAILRTQVIDLRGVREQDVAYMARLEAALRKYGRHRRDLPHPCMYPDGDCTCGLDAALAGGE